MAKRMIGIRVSISRYVSDEPQPGIVECQFSDAHGRKWHFVDKTAVVSEDLLDSKTSYPQPGIIACEVIDSIKDAKGREIMVISTERPWCVEAVDGSMQFEVLRSSLVEWDWDSNVKRQWDGPP
jgi:hypothetical protein